MMNKYLFILLFTSLSLFSCKENIYYLPNINHVNTDSIISLIKGERIQVDEIGLRSLQTIDSFIIAYTYNPDCQLIIYNTDFNCIAKLCPKGRGHNEFNELVSLEMSRFMSNSWNIIVKDAVNNKVCMIDISKSIKEQHCIITDTLGEDESFEQNYFLNDNRSFVLKNVSYEDARDNLFYPPLFYIINGHGKKTYIDIYPVIAPNIEAAGLSTIIYQFMLTIKPDCSKIAISQRFTDITTMVDLNDFSCYGIAGNDYVDINDIIINNNSENNPIFNKIKNGAIGLYTSDKYFFELYDERTIYESDFENKSLKTSIRVYNWNGDFVTKLNFDESLTSITYNDTNKSLYALDKDENIYRYNLKDILD